MSIMDPRDLQSEFQSLVDRLFEFPFSTELPLPRIATMPALDLYEQSGNYIVELAVPGYDAKEISAEVNGNVLTVSGSHSESTEKKDAKYHRREIRRGSFNRMVALPQDLDPNKVDAKVEKGVLKITLTPATPLAAKKIEIK